MSDKQPLDTMGTVLNVSQSIRKSWSMNGGEITTSTWKGAYDEVNAQYETLKSVAGYTPTWDTLDFDLTNGRATLVARAASDGMTLYELFRNKEQLPLQCAKYFLYDAPVLASDDVANCYNAFSQGILPSETGFTDKQLEFYNHLMEGVDKVLQTSWVLRETKNVSKRSQITATLSGIDTVQDTPDVAAANSLIGTLPEGEWLYVGPDVRQYGVRRYQIVSEWWWRYKWSKRLYGGTWEPA